MENPIKRYREKQGLKQLDLGLLLGVSEMTISHWERGARRPRDTMVLKLAEVLKVEPQTLTTELMSYIEEKRKDIKHRIRTQIEVIKNKL